MRQTDTSNLNPLRPPDFVAVGHVTKDLLADGGFLIGGTATYASVTARNLGKQAAIVTSASADLALAERLPGVQISLRPAQATTAFENIYEGGRRHQFVRAVAEPLTAADVPDAWRRAPIVLLGPLVRELGAEMLSVFPGALLGVTAQGWMRRWNSDGLVHDRRWDEAHAVLPLVDVLFFSYEDVGYDLERLKAYASLAKTAVVTHSHLGAIVYHGGRSQWYPGFQTKEVDPTGAGDVFAAAYMVAYHEMGDPFEPARFANCTASLSIEGRSISTIPSREQVEARLRENRLVDDLTLAEREMIDSVLI